MTRLIMVAVAAAVAATTVAVPAHAEARADDCTKILTVQEEPDFQSFSIDLQTLQVRIQPGAADDDAKMLVNYYVLDVVAFTLCVEGGVVTGTVQCLLDRAQEIAGSLDPHNLYFRYVYRDPMTGEIVIDGGRLVSDLSC